MQLELLALTIYSVMAAHRKQRLKCPAHLGWGEGVVIRLSAFLGIICTNIVRKMQGKAASFSDSGSSCGVLGLLEALRMLSYNSSG